MQNINKNIRIVALLGAVILMGSFIALRASYAFADDSGDFTGSSIDAYYPDTSGDFTGSSIDAYYPDTSGDFTGSSIDAYYPEQDSSYPGDIGDSGCGYDSCGSYDTYYGGDSYGCDSCNTYDSYGSYGSYGCSSCNSYPSYSYPVYTPTTTYHPPVSTPSSVYSNNTNNNFSNSQSSASSTSTATATAVNNNNNPINIVVNVPNGGTNTNNQTLSVYCTASPSNPIVGNTVTWQANATGGNGNYYYSWSGAAYGSGQSVSNVYYNTGTENATVNVNSNGQTVSASCSVNVQPNGVQAAYTTYYQTPTTYGTPSAGVYLSQIPATGISMNSKMALFFIGLFAWSAFGAYMIIAKRNADNLVPVAVGVSASEMDVNDEDEDPTKLTNETNDEEDLESNLSFRARENNVLISRDGISTIMARTANDKSAAESMLGNLISKVSRNDGNYATLNSEKINQLLG